MGRTPAAPKTGRGAPTDDELAAALDAMDPPAEPPATEDPRMGIPEGWPMIHTLIARILGDVGPVLKTQRNTTQNYNFRGVDQVVDAVNAAFKKHRVYPRSEIIEATFQNTVTTKNAPTREVTGRIRFIFTAPDGSTTATEVLTESLDQSDKGGPKAMSVALRIALLQMLLLPTTDPTTDDDGHYHTRDGVGAMSAPVAVYVLEKLAEADLYELLTKLRPIIDGHAAWDREVPGGHGTWNQNFVDRTAWIISEASSYAEGLAIKEKLEAANLLGTKTQGGETMAELLRKRGQELREMYSKTLDHVMGRIMAARGQDELDIATGCGWAALEAGTILEKALNEALAVAEERRAKLPEFAPQPEADDDGALEDAHADGPEDEYAAIANGGGTSDGEPGPGQWDDPADASAGALVRDEPPFDGPYVQGTEPVGLRQTAEERREAYRAFCIRAAAAAVAGKDEEPSIRENIVVELLTDLITGDVSQDPVIFYGTDGFVVVDDAIKAAHRREGSIGDEARRVLDELLAVTRKAAEEVGLND